MCYLITQSVKYALLKKKPRKWVSVYVLTYGVCELRATQTQLN